MRSIKTSGPPGSHISTTLIWVGRLILGPNCFVNLRWFDVVWICSFEKGFSFKFYLVRVTWSNVVDAMV